MKVDVGPYTPIPNRFFGSGLAAKLGCSASLLYIVLWDHANRKSSNTFSVSDRALASDTGLGTRTICDARKCLCEYGLITFVRPEGRSYTYTLFKPSLEWVPIKERPRTKLKPRANRSLVAMAPQQNLLTLPSQNLLAHNAKFADPPRKVC